jgi:hypothetical protein
MGPDDTAVNEHRNKSVVITKEGLLVRYDSSPQIINLLAPEFYN